MANINNQANIKVLFDKIRSITKESVQPQHLKPIGDETADIIRRRARLGYGASEMGGSRFSFKRLSPRYIKFRKSTGAAFLSALTYSAPKSNLTFTGQMLDSLTARVENGKVYISPTGQRNDPFSRGKSNADIARYVAKGGRPFLFLTKPELSQVVRFYRTTFGDLARRKGF